jgi:hypothetical protein
VLRQVALLVLGSPIELDIYPVGLKEFPMWPASVMDAVGDSMVREQALLATRLYRPKLGRSGAEVATCHVMPPAGDALLGLDSPRSGRASRRVTVRRITVRR